MSFSQQMHRGSGMISISFSLNIVLIFGNGFYRQSKSVVLRGAYFSIFLTNKQDKGKAYYINVKLQICWEAFVKYLVAHFQWTLSFR